MTNQVPFIRLWTDTAAACGNIFRVQWDDGTETGYPTDEIRDRAIQAIADSRAA